MEILFLILTFSFGALIPLGGLLGGFSMLNKFKNTKIKYLLLEIILLYKYIFKYI